MNYYLKKPLLSYNLIYDKNVKKIREGDHWICPKTGNIIIEENLREKIFILNVLIKYGFIKKNGMLSIPANKFLREIDIIIQTIIIEIQFGLNNKEWDMFILDLLYDNDFLCDCWHYYWNYYCYCKTSYFYNKHVFINNLFIYVNTLIDEPIRPKNIDEYHIKNICSECQIEIGDTNPRKLCGKTRCLNVV